MTFDKDAGPSPFGVGSGKTPRILHYVWVGDRPKPPWLVARVERWKQVLPDYEIREWNEQSLDWSSVAYVRQAYRAKAFAFVSDYLRLHALFEEGGIYVDTDVEVLGSFDPLLDGITTFGFEIGHAVATSTIIAAQGCDAIAGLRQDYKSREFIDRNGRQDRTTNVERITHMLTRHGLELRDVEQRLSVAGAAVRVVPSVVLSPYDYLRGIDRRSNDTIAVHLFEGSWLSPVQRLRKVAKTIVRPLVSRFSGKRQ